MVAAKVVHDTKPTAFTFVASTPTQFAYATASFNEHAALGGVCKKANNVVALDLAQQFG